jgi:hypothetical protein
VLGTAYERYEPTLTKYISFFEVISELPVISGAVVQTHFAQLALIGTSPLVGHSFSDDQEFPERTFRRADGRTVLGAGSGAGQRMA